MGRIPQLVQSAPSPVGIRPRGSFTPWFRLGGAPLPVAAYQAKSSTSANGYAVASLAASYTNLANPGVNDAAPGVAPTWAAGTGWTFNGSTQYLVTGVVPASGYSMLIQFTNGPTATITWLCGEFKANARFDIQPSRTGADVRYGSGGLTVVAPHLTSGNLGIAGQQGYRNGTADGSAIGAWSALATDDIYIGCYNFNGVGASNFISAKVQAFAIYSVTLTAPQVAAVAAGMAAL